MSDRPPRKSFFIGRWQPLHIGHIALIKTALHEGRDIVIGIMATPPSGRNPYTVQQRIAMLREAFAEEFAAERIEFIVMPWIDEVCYGRQCGWSTRHIALSPEIEAISATEIREGKRNGGS